MGKIRHAVLGGTAGEWPGVEGSLLLVAVILLAALGTGVLLFASVVAYRRRRSTRYALVTLAVGALFGRSIVGIGTVYGVVPMTVHHLLEHTLDFTIALLVLYAVYRRSEPQLETAPRDG